VARGLAYGARKSDPRRERELALALWAVARGVRGAALVDENMPARALDAVQLTAAARQALGPDGARVVAVLRFPPSDAIFLCNPAVLLARLAAPRCARVAAWIDVGGTIALPLARMPLAAAAGLLRLRAALAAALAASDHQADPGSPGPDAPLVIDVAPGPPMPETAMVALAGWLLGYPAVYCVGGDLCGRYQGCLSSAPLAVCAVELVGGKDASSKLLSFSAPQALWDASPVLRAAARSALADAARLWNAAARGEPGLPRAVTNETLGVVRSTVAL
jgi:hypothetical protein